MSRTFAGVWTIPVHIFGNLSMSLGCNAQLIFCKHAHSAEACALCKHQTWPIRHKKKNYAAHSPRPRSPKSCLKSNYSFLRCDQNTNWKYHDVKFSLTSPPGMLKVIFEKENIHVRSRSLLQPAERKQWKIRFSSKKVGGKTSRRWTLQRKATELIENHSQYIGSLFGSHG